MKYEVLIAMFISEQASQSLDPEAKIEMNNMKSP